MTDRNNPQEYRKNSPSCREQSRPPSARKPLQSFHRRMSPAAPSRRTPSPDHRRLLSPNIGRQQLLDGKTSPLRSPSPRGRFTTSGDKPLISQFLLIKTLGHGTYGRVVHAYHRDTNRYYAIKMLSKQKIYDSKQIKNLLNEKSIMSALRFEFVIRLVFFFQDNSYLYFVLPFLPGGDLYFHLKRFSKFTESLAKFYISQVVLALEYLHSLDLVHRDVKPENILIDIDGFIKLSDFGFCKRVTGRTFTICGTPEYFAPEIIAGKGYGKAVDWWSTGVMLYELVYGLSPFLQSSLEQTYAQIHSGEYKMQGIFSYDLRDLLHRLLQTDPTNRIGNYKRGPKDIRHHAFFNEIVWPDLLMKKVVPPYRPYIKHPEDTSNFKTFDKEEPVFIAAQNKFHDYFNAFDS